MTIENYELYIERGIAGPGTSTCHPAAFDCVSERHSVPPGTYVAFNNFFEGDPAQQPKFRELESRLYRELGCRSLAAVAGQRVEDERTLAAVLANYRQGGRRVAIYTEADHIVGLRSVDEKTWQLVGILPPDAPAEPLPAEDVFSFLMHERRRNGRRTWDNVVSLPAEPRRRRTTSLGAR